MTVYLRVTIVAIAALALALPASAGAKRSVPRGFYAVNWDGDIQRRNSPELIEREWLRMTVSGVESARVSFEWVWAQPERGMEFDFSRTDPIVAASAVRRVRLLPVVILAPPWARRNRNADFSPPKKAGRYAAYLTALIRRYGPRGTFWSEHPELPRRPLRAWQIWNEPHLQYQWTVPRKEDWAVSYGKLLRRAYRAVKRADPRAKVVLGGISNFSWRYLARLYRRGNIKNAFDVAAVHPYTRTAEGVVSIVRRFRRTMRRRRDLEPVWITELGLPASKNRCHSSNVLQTSDRGMAAFLRGSYAALRRARRRRATRVNRVFWYTWASEYSECRDIFRYTGLLQYKSDDEVSSKPAYRAYKRSARRDQDCTKQPNGACARR